MRGWRDITLSNERAIEVARIMEGAAIVPIHAERLAHFNQSPQQLREAFEAAGLRDRLVVIAPGERAVLESM